MKQPWPGPLTLDSEIGLWYLLDNPRWPRRRRLAPTPPKPGMLNPTESLDRERPILDDLNLSSITKDRRRNLSVRLRNIIETVAADLRNAQAKIQRLREEINRLKGKQGKPVVKPPTPPHGFIATYEALVNTRQVTAVHIPAHVVWRTVSAC